jgi:hypothetical protein
MVTRGNRERGMRVKVFVGNGIDGIMASENDMNQWLAEQSGDFAVKHIKNTACSVSDGPDSEQYQSVVFSIWYEGGA